jgi:hypothetical protein
LWVGILQFSISPAVLIAAKHLLLYLLGMGLHPNKSVFWLQDEKKTKG